MLRRPSSGLLGGMWELPSSDGDGVEALVEAIALRAGVHTRLDVHVGIVEHTFSHRALSLDVFRLRLSRATRSRLSASARWCTASAREDLPLSRLTRKTFELAGL